MAASGACLLLPVLPANSRQSSGCTCRCGALGIRGALCCKTPVCLLWGMLLRSLLLHKPPQNWLLWGRIRLLQGIAAQEEQEEEGQGTCRGKEGGGTRWGGTWLEAPM